MKKPNRKNLRLDEFETKNIRSMMAREKSVKITININANTLSKLKRLSDDTGVPYQRLINRTLTESLAAKNKTDSRLERIEKELLSLKKKIAA